MRKPSSADSGLRFDVNQADIDAILAHLASCDGSFIPPLSTRVDLCAYVRKLRERARTWECWDASLLVGLVAAYSDNETETTFISSVSVLPSHGRRGIARHLVESCLKQSADSGILRIGLEVGQGNTAAIRLYEQLGFAIVRHADTSLLMEKTSAPSGKV